MDFLGKVRVIQFVVSDLVVTDGKGNSIRFRCLSDGTPVPATHLDQMAFEATPEKRRRWIQQAITKVTEANRDLVSRQETERKLEQCQPSLFPEPESRTA